MLYPSMNKLMESVDSRYSLVIAVAKHARQISDEAEKTNEILDDKPVKLSINDIADKKVKIIMHEPDEEWEETASPNIKEENTEAAKPEDEPELTGEGEGEQTAE